MPLDDYGVLVGRAIRRRREGRADSPHYQVHVAAGGDFRVAVNVLSQEQPSELLYVVADDLRHPVTAAVANLATGWHDLPSRPGGASLDHVRANLFARAAMRTLPADATGPDNDLADLLDHYVERAIASPGARVFAFGQRWGPEAGRRDTVFGFRPGNGVHDIHMNQGNAERFRRDAGVWQDGAVLVHFPADGRWVGVFLAFQSQSFHTHDATGHAIPLPEPVVVPAEPPVAIVAAMVNPSGPAPERESVLLLNVSPQPVDLSGWRVANGLKRACAVPGGRLAAGATRSVPLTNGVTMGDQGGAITLLDAQGLKVHGVAYTAEQAAREGWTVVF